MPGVAPSSGQRLRCAAGRMPRLGMNAIELLIAHFALQRRASTAPRACRRTASLLMCQTGLGEGIDEEIMREIDAFEAGKLGAREASNVFSDLRKDLR